MVPTGCYAVFTAGGSGSYAGLKELPWMAKSSCAPVTRKPSVPGLTRCLISPSSRKSKYQESEIQYLSRLLPQRSAPAWEATQSVGQQLRVGKESKEKGEGDIYLGVLLKQKMLTSPQSFINCSFQVCQRGEGELGRLKRAERERGDRLMTSGRDPLQLHIKLCTMQGLLGRHQSQGCRTHQDSRELGKGPRV